MDMPSLQTIQNFNLQHTDVLEKLKMQVRDMKVNLIVSVAWNAKQSSATQHNLKISPIFRNFPKNRTKNTSMDVLEFRHRQIPPSPYRLSCRRRRWEPQLVVV